MKKILVLAFSVLALLSSCSSPRSAKNLTMVMQQSLDQKIDKLDAILVDDLGFVRSPRMRDKVRYEMGDTLVTVVPQMGDNTLVGGVFMSINISDPERAIATYKEYRDLLRGSHPYYGAKIIYWEPEYSEYSSTDSLTIDTISAEYLKNNRININERWHELEDYNNRNSVALIRNDKFGTWTMNVIYRHPLAQDF